MDRKAHWERIYRTQPLEKSGWHQAVPQTSLLLIESLGLRKTDPIIDIGGGDSLLTDHLLDRGYTDLTVLDISAAAIQRAKDRLGNRADQAHWIEADITDFRPERTYACWHDRAAFHFLIRDEHVQAYLEALRQGTGQGSKLVIGTFSDQGPDRCSGLPVQQYSDDSLTQRFQPQFERIDCLRVDHRMPSGTLQNYLFCSFKKVE